MEKQTGEEIKFYHGLGCKKCRNTGYAGRIAIHELFIPSEKTQEMISKGATAEALRAQATKEGMIPLQLDGIEKVKAGIVTIEEIVRITATIGEG